MWLGETCTWTTQVTDSGQGKGRHKNGLIFLTYETCTQKVNSQTNIHHHYIVQILYLNCNELNTHKQLNHIKIFQVFTVQTVQTVAFHTLTQNNIVRTYISNEIIIPCTQVYITGIPSATWSKTIPTILFNLVLESTMRKTTTNLGGIIFMIHADDVLIIGRMFYAIK